MSRTQAILKKLKAIRDWKLWLVFFVYSLDVSLSIQLVLLPYIFPQWNAGNGLIARRALFRLRSYAGRQAN